MHRWFILGAAGAALALAGCTGQTTTPGTGGSPVAQATAQSPVGTPASPAGKAPVQASPAAATRLAVQRLERGHLLWRGDTEQIYALYDDGTYQVFPDTFESGDPESGGSPAPAGLQEPVRGFGELWRENASVREKLGWAIAPEQGVDGSISEATGRLTIDAQGLGQWVLRDNNQFEKTR